MMRMRVCCTSAEALKSESDWWELEYILWHKRTERDIILPRHYLIPEMLIDNSLKTLGISPSYTHVKGHQDKGLVAPELERIQPKPSVPFAAETGVKLEEVDGHTITHHVPSQIHLAKRHHWEHNEFDWIHWHIVRRSLLTFGISRRNFLIKRQNLITPVMLLPYSLKVCFF